jgi:hypothetical protein
MSTIQITVNIISTPDHPLTFHLITSYINLHPFYSQAADGRVVGRIPICEIIDAFQVYVDMTARFNLPPRRPPRTLPARWDKRSRKILRSAKDMIRCRRT